MILLSHLQTAEHAQVTCYSYTRRISLVGSCDCCSLFSLATDMRREAISEACHLENSDWVNVSFPQVEEDIYLQTAPLLCPMCYFVNPQDLKHSSIHLTQLQKTFSKNTASHFQKCLGIVLNHNFLEHDVLEDKRLCTCVYFRHSQLRNSGKFKVLLNYGLTLYTYMTSQYATCQTDMTPPWPCVNSRMLNAYHWK